MQSILYAIVSMLCYVNANSSHSVNESPDIHDPRDPGFMKERLSTQVQPLKSTERSVVRISTTLGDPISTDSAVGVDQMIDPSSTISRSDPVNLIPHFALPVELSLSL